MKTVMAERVIHGGLNRVALRFPQDAELIRITRRLSDPRWSKQMNCWHISDNTDAITVLLKAFAGKAYVDYTGLKTNLAEEVRVKGEEEQRKNPGKKKYLTDTELPSLTDKAREDIDKYRRWMEANRYPESTIQTYTALQMF